MQTLVLAIRKMRQEDEVDDCLLRVPLPIGSMCGIFTYM